MSFDQIVYVTKEYWGGEGRCQFRKTQTNQNLSLLPGDLLDEHDQELCMTAKTTVMINKTR